jgi:hypothetical protein
MDSNKRTQRSSSLIIAVIVVTLGLGCLCLPAGLAPTSTPTSTPAFLPTSTSRPTLPPPTATQAPVVPGAALNSEGPWLLIETGQGLWAVNPDGSGLTQLTTLDYWHGDLQAAVQPGGNQVVFISPGDYDFHHMALNLLTLPDGKVTKLTDLTSPQTEAYTDSGPGGTGFEALRAVGERSSYAWSPDGTRLTFVGVMDGPSAELYLYDETIPKIMRVSQDNTQDFAPSWSPDGEHLLYLGADGFGTGAGFVMSGVWAAAGDGSATRQLYATASSGEEIVGWLDNTTAVLDTWSVVCGPGKLRLYDVVTRKQSMLNDDCITSAVAKGGGGAAMFTTESGLYLLTAEALAPVQVSQEPGARIDPWGPDDYVFTVRFENGGIATYGTSEIEHQASPVTPSSGGLEVAMYGLIWGWTSQAAAQPGAWISGPGVEIGQIYTGQARCPAWDPHNNLLFFARSDSGGFDLLLTTFDAYYTDLNNVNHIDADVNSVVWLGPR